MNDQWTDRLSEYLDDELAPAERGTLEAHLATCPACQQTLAELREVVARAQALEDRPPATDLWFGIRARMTPGRRPGVSRRVAFTVPQLIAASIALVALSGSGVWLALHNGRGGTGGGTSLAQQSQATPAPDVYAVDSRWKVQTDMAIAELQEELALNEAQLDTATVRVVRQNLAVIDRAIAEAQRALKRDPNSGYLRLHLANTMRQKIELLRRANAIAASES